MTQNTNSQNTCGVCHRTFNSDGELQEHKKTSHAQHENNNETTGRGEGQSKSEQKKVA